MSIRLKYSVGPVDVHYDSAVSEYRCSYRPYRQLATSGILRAHFNQRFDLTSYFTNDILDADQTARHMARNIPDDLVSVVEPQPSAMAEEKRLVDLDVARLSSQQPLLREAVARIIAPEAYREVKENSYFGTTIQPQLRMNALAKADRIIALPPMGSEEAIELLREQTDLVDRLCMAVERAVENIGGEGSLTVLRLLGPVNDRALAFLKSQPAQPQDGGTK